MRRSSYLIFSCLILSLVSASSASATTTCSQLQGNWAIKMVGANIDNGTATEPAPQPVAGVGVINIAANCTVTGELIFNNNGTYTGPGSDGFFASVTGFTGSLAGNLFGQVFPGVATVLRLEDHASGDLFFFAINIESGNAEFLGTNISSPTGAPISIVGEKQATVTSTQFLSNSALVCDGINLHGNLVGFGYSSVSETLQANLDPDGTGATKAGGVWISNGIPGIPFVQQCGFTATVNSNSVNSTLDGTENTEAIYNNDYNNTCVLQGLDFETSAVLWGATNKNAFVILTGTNSGPVPAVVTCKADPISVVKPTLTPASATITIPATSPSTSKTLVLTNNSNKPLNIASISVSGAVTSEIALSVTGASCPSIPGDLFGSNGVVGGGAACSINLTCNKSTVGTDTGTLIIDADNFITGGTPTPLGQTFPISCKKI